MFESHLPAVAERAEIWFRHNGKLTPLPVFSDRTRSLLPRKNEFPIDRKEKNARKQRENEERANEPKEQSVDNGAKIELDER